LGTWRGKRRGSREEGGRNNGIKRKIRVTGPGE
jgi:hypothetical protein